MNKVTNDIKFEYSILKKFINENVPFGASLLALTMDVSQATIGRKLQELEYKGYLQKYSNKGRFLTDEGKGYFLHLEKEIQNTKRVENIINEPNELSKENIIDVLNVRKILEKETAVLATKNITPEDLAKLKEIINLQEFKAAQGLSVKEEALLFHSLLARLSGNKVLENILTLVLTQNEVYADICYIRKKISSTVVTDHKAILKAIEMKDSELAGALTEKHINKIIEDVNVYFENS